LHVCFRAGFTRTVLEFVQAGKSGLDWNVQTLGQCFMRLCQPREHRRVDLPHRRGGDRMSRIRITSAGALRRNFAFRLRQPATELGADRYDASGPGSLRQNRRLQFHRLLVAVAAAADESRVGKRCGLPQQECDYRERKQPLQQFRRDGAASGARFDRLIPFIHGQSAALRLFPLPQEMAQGASTPCEPNGRPRIRERN
jgi:hypothetical protein